MEKWAWINFLYDFYGQLLTPRQQKFTELYYANDLSLGEIAEQFAISRQAVHDVLKRAEHTLSGYEEKLGLAGKFLAQKERLAEAGALLAGYRPGQEEKIVRAREILKEVTELER
ncbi:YlxM family DNA-binding protein [Desulfotomaculum copahuensis]|uniref:UPF0122 protein A6M21_15580 n=1 Tax=Desulfotomaculum copahuensis TaxID=1838280 RepID=A0A1B7LB09_9FIRM|nr:YlxM family DNA-binding protein [Desulfotomaculum copahuensis]OAT79519.1 DNA-binding protein [Desulfotomaculum copahuensis]